NKKKKILIGIIAAAVVVIAVVLIILFAGKSSGKGKIYVQSVKSLMGQDAFSNRFSGIVETQKTEKIELDLSREIAEIYVSEGTRVKAGQALFAYNTDALRLDIEQLQIEIEKCNTTIANSNEEIAELRSIMNNLSASDQLEYTAQIQVLQSDIAQAQYDIKTKEANITAKKNAIDKSTVTATMAGTVAKINDENAIRNADTGTPNVFMTVTAEGDFRIKGSVGEQNIFEITPGEQVIVRSRVNPDQTWTGTITSINTQGEEENTNDMYMVKMVQNLPPNIPSMSIWTVRKI
ncbi:MAG: HlyD family efflux transporter periplasmic adaptor subunit, partial [Parasporobacterium sp.]|nr:HlyD family efflux transporter periplasmic adaptor subunit [Parasporobacterium sp.]